MKRYDPGSAEPRLISISVDFREIKFADASPKISLPNVKLEVGGHQEAVAKLEDKTSGVILVCDDPRFLKALLRGAVPLEVRQLAKAHLKTMPDWPARRLVGKLLFAFGIVFGIICLYYGAHCLESVIVNLKPSCQKNP